MVQQTRQYRPYWANEATPKFPPDAPQRPVLQPGTAGRLYPFPARKRRYESRNAWMWPSSTLWKFVSE